MATVLIGPSILTADFLALGEEIAKVEAAGVDFIHLDVMDGQFVPNISFGPVVVAAVRRCTSLPLDVHLMIEEPERYVQAFVEAGADLLTVHVEACVHLHGTLRLIEESGAIPGVALNPFTPLADVQETLGLVGQVLIMSVNPGFGGQRFIPESLGRIGRLRQQIDACGSRSQVGVDGGVNASNIRRIVDAGADRLVVGSAVYSDRLTVEKSVFALRHAAES